MEKCPGAFSAQRVNRSSASKDFARGTIAPSPRRLYPCIPKWVYTLWERRSERLASELPLAHHHSKMSGPLSGRVDRAWSNNGSLSPSISVGRVSGSNPELSVPVTWPGPWRWDSTTKNDTKPPHPTPTISKTLSGLQPLSRGKSPTLPS